LELSVWDFGGQEEYYNNHHYFLSARSIFLVVWNVMEGLKGIEGLRFWLNSLKAHLPPPSSNEKPLYSIVVVGTHIDSVITPEISRPAREETIQKLFREVGHPGEAYIYREVSSKTGEGIKELLSLVENLALSHRYMGETIPQSFLKTEELVLELRDKHQAIPTILMEEFLSQLKKEKLVSAEEGVEAIKLLHAWGTCVHFGFSSSSSSLLSKYLVLDPSFLTKEVLSNLFNPDFASFIPDGRLEHETLKMIWRKFEDQAEFLIELLECFEVCFQIRDKGKEKNEQQTKAFWERKSIIPAYLPENPPKEFGKIWQEQKPEDENEIKRIYTFNIVPKELVNRLHVRLNHMMESSMVWRGGFFLESQRVKVLVRANVKEGKMELIVRGAYLEIAKSILEDIHFNLASISDYYPGVSSQYKETEDVPHGTPIPWWNISEEGLEKIGNQTGREIGHLLLYSQDEPGFSNELLGKKLEYSLWHLGTSLEDLEEAYCVANQETQTMFNAFRINLTKKFILTPQLFKRETWKYLDDEKERQTIIDSFQELTKHPWNNGIEVPIPLLPSPFSLFFNFGPFTRQIRSSWLKELLIKQGGVLCKVGLVLLPQKKIKDSMGKVPHNFHISLWL